MPDAMTAFLSKKGIVSPSEPSDKSASSVQWMLDQYRKNAAVKTAYVRMSDMRAESGRLVSDVCTWILDDESVKHLGAMLDIPFKYLQRIKGTKLFDDNINYWLDDCPLEDIVVKYEQTDGGLGMIRMMMPASEHDRRLTVEDVLAAMLDVPGLSDACVRRIHSDAHRDIIRISTIERSAAVLPDDIIETGVQVIIPRKIVAPKVSAYAHRLVCTNGATRFEQRHKMIIKGMTKPEVLALLKATMAIVWEGSSALLAGCCALAQERIEDPMYRLAVMSKEMRILPRAAGYALSLLQEFLSSERSDITEYDLVQLLTAVVHDPRIKPAARFAIEEGAGAYMAESGADHRCEKCKQVIPLVDDLLLA